MQNIYTQNIFLDVTQHGGNIFSTYHDMAIFNVVLSVVVIFFTWINLFFNSRLIFQVILWVEVSLLASIMLMLAFSTLWDEQSTFVFIIFFIAVIAIEASVGLSLFLNSIRLGIDNKYRSSI